MGVFCSIQYVVGQALVGPGDHDTLKTKLEVDTLHH